jgi:hypothetical protein
VVLLQRVTWSFHTEDSADDRLLHAASPYLNSHHATGRSLIPFLLVILVGIINFSVLFAQQLSLSNGARQAARYAVVAGNDCTAIRTQARNEATTIGMPAAGPAVNVSRCGLGGAIEPCKGTTPGTNITVTMRWQDDWLVSLPPFNVINAPALEGKGVMRCEYR